MQDGIGRATHGYIQSHRIEECLTRSNITRQNALVAILIISQGVLHNLTGCLAEQLYTIGMSSQDGAIAWKRESDSLCQRVHAVGCKHARARTTAGTRTTLDFLHLLIRDRRVGTLCHGRNQVSILTTPATCLHGASGTEDCRDVQTHRGHQHTRSHLITIRDANHGIGLMGIDHILYRVGNDVTRRQ